MRRIIATSGGSYAKGFSIVEVLVVIVLVGILSGTLLMSLKTLQKKAGSAQAQNRLLSMGHALSAYCTDNDGRLLEGANSPSVSFGGLASSRGPAVAFWFNALDYYINGKDQTELGMRNPERPMWQNDPLKKYPELKTSSGDFGVCVGYGWNHQYFGDDPSKQDKNGWGSRLVQVQLPTRTIIIGTGEDSFNANNLLRNPLIYANSIRCRRHSGGGYYLFLDGHVEKLTPEEVMENDSYLMRKLK